MDIFLVFNELSAHDGRSIEGATEYQAREWMKEFAEVITDSRKFGLKALKTYDDFFDKELVENYTIRNWLIDSSVDREIKRRIRSAGTSYWGLSKPGQIAEGNALPEQILQAENKILAFDFTCNERKSLGLGSAHLLESIAISLHTGEFWESTEIALGIEQFDEEADDIIISEVSVLNVSQSLQLDSHRLWIHKRFETSVDDGKYLLSKINEWYPNLIFTDNVKSQIATLHSGTPQLRQAVKKLFELEIYCMGWDSGAFDKNKIPSKVTPESMTVRNNPSLRSQRVFKLPDGTEGFFEWHFRLTPDPWRLHFLPVPSKRKIYIGYIGDHLDTARY